MTRRFFLFLSLLTFLPASAFAADFTATISSDHIGLGEGLTLQLTLSGTEPKSPPNTEALRQSFTIVSQNQSSNTIGVNGATGSRVGWQLTLAPKQQGELVIPAMTIDTVAGKLSTAPMILEVDPGPVAKSSGLGAGGGAVSITATADTLTPYQNQPIQYTVRYVVRADISNASLNDLNVDNALVEERDKPDVYDRIEGGAPVKVVEFHYTITPLQPGKIRIPPVVLQGEIETPDRVVLTDPFGRRIDSTGIQQAMNFFSRLAGGQPFSVASNETVLDVKPPAAALDPWLPLTSLKIKEDVDAQQQAQVGEPLTRTITLLADGAAGNQLPDVEAQQDHTNFKVYADKPAMGEDIDKKTGTVIGWRKESYSLIPQKAGRLVLPAIRVSWWDIVNGKVAIAELPKRVVNVLPGVADAGAASRSQDTIAGQFTAMKYSVADMAVAKIGVWLLYISISAIVAALLIFALSKTVLRGKPERQRAADASATARATPVPRKPSPGSASESMLEHVHTAAALRDFLQTYAHEQWNVPGNLPLRRIFEILPRSGVEQARRDLEALIDGLDAALYGGGAVDLENLKSCCRRVILGLKRKTHRDRRDAERLPHLNPS